MLRIVIFPQALRLAAPPFISLCVNLVKATSLVSIVGLWELTMASREVVERTLAPFQIFIGAARSISASATLWPCMGRYLERRVPRWSLTPATLPRGRCWRWPAS